LVDEIAAIGARVAAVSEALREYDGEPDGEEGPPEVESDSETCSFDEAQRAIGKGKRVEAKFSWQSQWLEVALVNGEWLSPSGLARDPSTATAWRIAKIGTVKIRVIGWMGNSLKDTPYEHGQEIDVWSTQAADETFRRAAELFNHGLNVKLVHRWDGSIDIWVDKGNFTHR